MPIKYLFSITYWTPDQKDGNRHEVEEFILAETIEQAMAYWRTEFIDEATEITSIKRHVAVIAICPEAIATRYGYLRTNPAASSSVSGAPQGDKAP